MTWLAVRMGRLSVSRYKVWSFNWVHVDWVSRTSLMILGVAAGLSLASRERFDGWASWEKETIICWKFSRPQYVYCEVLRVQEREFVWVVGCTPRLSSSHPLTHVQRHVIPKDHNFILVHFLIGLLLGSRQVSITLRDSWQHLLTPSLSTLLTGCVITALEYYFSIDKENSFTYSEMLFGHQGVNALSVSHCLCMQYQFGHSTAHPNQLHCMVSTFLRPTVLSFWCCFLLINEPSFIRCGTRCHWNVSSIRYNDFNHIWTSSSSFQTRVRFHIVILILSLWWIETFSSLGFLV